MLYDTVLEGEVGGAPHEIDRDALYAYFVPGAPLPPLPATPADAPAGEPAATPPAVTSAPGAPTHENASGPATTP